MIVENTTVELISKEDVYRAINDVIRKFDNGRYHMDDIYTFGGALDDVIENLKPVNSVKKSETIDEDYLWHWYNVAGSDDWTGEQIENLCHDFYLIPKRDDQMIWDM